MDESQRSEMAPVGLYDTYKVIIYVHIYIYLQQFSAILYSVVYIH